MKHQTIMESIMKLLFLTALCSQARCVSRHQYVLIQTPKTWSDAQSYCREKCIDIATIEDMREMNIVLDYTKGSYSDAVWIGLQKGINRRWLWSLADKDFYKEGESTYFKWKNGATDSYNCGTYKNGLLDTIYCSYQTNAVCFDSTKKGADQYILTTGMAWTAARDFCRQNFTDLTSLRNDAEYQTVQNVANGMMVYVGLFRDLWEWSDQSNSSFRYWRKSQSVYSGIFNCVAMLQVESGRWGDRNCTEAHPFLCKCTKATVIKLRISSQDSTLDLNDPAVQNSILEQMKSKLSGNNSEGAQLQWKKQSDGKVFTKDENDL